MQVMHLLESGFHHDTQLGYLRATAAKDLSMQFFGLLKASIDKVSPQKCHESGAPDASLKECWRNVR